jgi:hypothetical protein
MGLWGVWQLHTLLEVHRREGTERPLTISLLTKETFSTLCTLQYGATQQTKPESSRVWTVLLTLPVICHGSPYRDGVRGTNRLPLFFSGFRPTLESTQPHIQWVKSKSKAIPVTDRGGVYGSEMLRIPHCLDNRLIDGGKVVSPTHRPPSTPQKHYISGSDTHFC